MSWVVRRYVKFFGGTVDALINYTEVELDRVAWARFWSEVSEASSLEQCLEMYGLDSVVRQWAAPWMRTRQRLLKEVVS